MERRRWHLLLYAMVSVLAISIAGSWWLVRNNGSPVLSPSHLMTLGSFLLILAILSIIYHMLRVREKNHWVNKAKELEMQAEQRNDELHQKNTQLQTVLDDIKHMAYYDTLTNLPNRRLFMSKLSNSLEMAKQENHMLAVLFLDIDSFKLINDTMGHNFGDQVLKRVGEKIEKSLRGFDIASRQGGDEFTILLDRISSIEEIKQMVETIHNSVAESFIINDVEINVQASTGIALYTRHGAEIDNLITYADIAMYKAKELGKNQYVFYTAEMNNLFVRRLSMDKELRSAIENEELSLYFQPQVNIDSGEIVGLESLVRWNNPLLGWVSPCELIPMAEENGQIVPIGEWVLTNSCRQFKEWLEEGYVLPKLAVNISPIQFNDEKLEGIVKRILRETGLEPQYLELEITEGVAMYNEESVFKKLMNLKNLGVKVALDDFGSGYSSLAYLFQFPFDTLKIDQSLMRNIINNTNNKILVETIINMAHGFNINVLAEGVDTIEQFQFLREKNCDEIQGYLISKPLSSVNLISLLEKYKVRPVEKAIS